MKPKTCNECMFFKTLGDTGVKRVCYLYINNNSSVSPTCRVFKINHNLGFRTKRGKQSE